MTEGNMPARRGLMFVLSSPSGAGKSTLSRLLLDSDRDIKLSISVTTRERRPSELEGVHYHFVSKRQFQAMRDRGDLLEWAEVHGNFYGTPRDPIDAAVEDGRDTLFDIDWQGTLQLYENRRSDVVSVFVLPPSMAELRSRLERRAEDDPAVIARRLKNAEQEIVHWNEYDYVLINDDLQAAFEKIRAILTVERLRRQRRTAVAEFVESLIGDAAMGSPTR